MHIINNTERLLNQALFLLKYNQSKAWFFFNLSAYLIRLVLNSCNIPYLN